MRNTDNVAMACPKCFLGAGLRATCSKCGGPTEMVNLGRKINLPKKNDRRAWKRIFNGEAFWNRRKVKKKAQDRRDTISIFEYREVPINDTCDCDHDCCRLNYRPYKIERVPGSEKKITNYNRSPDVDLGG